MAVAYTMEDHSQRLCQNILREMKKIKIGNNEEYLFMLLQGIIDLLHTQNFPEN